MLTTSPVLGWLLEPSDPSIRYRTLTELLGMPADGPEVVAAQGEIPRTRAVERILSRMHPDGYWLQRTSAGRLVGDGVEYAPSATTHYCLAHLAELGLDRRHPAVTRAADRYLDLQSPDGDFWLHMSCLYGYNIRTFTMLGYGDDARLARTAALMLSTERPDGGYLCDQHERPRARVPVRSCVRGSAKALGAFASLPMLWGTARCQALVDYFLRRDGLYRTDDFARLVVKEAGMTVFPFTWGCGLLDVLLALATMGHGSRPELAGAWAVLESKRDDLGRYTLDLTPSGALFRAGPRGRPNKWVTFYAMLALARR